MYLLVGNPPHANRECATLPMYKSDWRWRRRRHCWKYFPKAAFINASAVLAMLWWRGALVMCMLLWALKRPWEEDFSSLVDSQLSFNLCVVSWPNFSMRGYVNTSSWLHVTARSSFMQPLIKKLARQSRSVDQLQGSFGSQTSEIQLLRHLGGKILCFVRRTTSFVFEWKVVGPHHPPLSSNPLDRSTMRVSLLRKTSRKLIGPYTHEHYFKCGWLKVGQDSFWLDYDGIDCSCHRDVCHFIMITF